MKKSGRGGYRSVSAYVKESVGHKAEGMKD